MKDIPETNPQGGLTLWLSRADQVAARLAATAVARDREGQDPVEEISWLREAGLLTIALPVAVGGAVPAPRKSCR
ncbi:hypothetical protein HOY34_06595 [Xinfangfangia sp. D13-10-4-6]|uniref:hypothetical protein n=1 Tax=Pseudogemmobacter hezensis TaxID=2737662 RepID=UPI001553E12F|nr:hypothetical protein [Pseudogemmobacter hezensis]NPD14875.1 hypothetical protein [Pseudogemmobacter hezensis]